jgi:hypothetical protein
MKINEREDVKRFTVIVPSLSQVTPTTGVLTSCGLCLNLFTYHLQSFYK